jgi:cytochrome P450
MEDSDVVHDLSEKLPQVTFFDMMGVPQEDRPRVSALFAAAEDAEAFMAAADPLALATEFNGRLIAYGAELAARRRVEPADDLMTSLVEAEVDGERLTDIELGAAMILLAIAGTDTTKQTTSHAVKALMDHPEQRRWLQEDLDGRLNVAVEELIRWSSAINQFSRVATVDTELGGQQIRAGEKLTMIYGSGNRDERAFTDPHLLDLSRMPNVHVGFGGGGIHFCLGVHVARAELRIVLRELMTHVPDLELGEPIWATRNSLINGIEHLPAHNPSPR